MGVPVYNCEDTFSDEDSNGPCSCSCTSYNTTSNESANASSAGANISSTHYMASAAYKDIVGNCKEVRIDENTCNLRIVGNNNRIRITINTGDLIVIGNNTRLKIQQNHGHIKYTGNDGRISLGAQSQQQLVDYIGCNGVLKICNSMKASATATTKAKCTKQQVNNNVGTNANKSPENLCSSSCETAAKQLYCQLPLPCEMGNSKTTKNIGNNKGRPSKEKSHSYCGGTSQFTPDHSAASSQWHTFNHMFKESNRKSMPNLSGHTYEPKSRCSQEHPSSIIQTIGNIVIANASNICIAPYVRNFTAKA